MDAPKPYSPQEIENKWYQHWMEKEYFYSTPNDKKAYTIVIPPPNVTGVLHMGHMLNNTIQDVLIRRARMKGFNACWVPGTDHASIATEAKVVKMLADKGIAKKDLTRDEFLNHAFEWKEKYGGIILEQLKKLGASADWKRTAFTMDPEYYQSVITVFIDLYNKGLIYRGTRMVQWDPQGRTTLSDEEVIFGEENDELYFVKYQIENTNDFLTIATARPETIAGDVAVCVNPNDERYKHLIGKNVLVPLINRSVKIISDDYIDIEFGTGILKVTPAHDIHDYEIGLKNNLPVFDTLNDDGTISEAGILFVGKDRFEARKLWVAELEKNNLLEKKIPYTHNVGRSERTNAIVEPKISTQWFLNMKEFMKKNPEVLNSVINDEIKFYPEKYKNTYKYWIENIKDWNISRQLWWGHRIPAWYNSSGEFVVANSVQNAIVEFSKKGISVTENEIKQDEDVLDTWASSWLWPLAVFGGFQNNADGKLIANSEELNYYYPTMDLVTAPEIIFFWVARMIMAGYEYTGKKPFANVYFTGIVRDKLRRKMSKSLGNSPDPLDLIEKYGADAVRLGMLLCSPAGNDILFDESQLVQGRNFCNKLWNANRLISMWQGDENIAERPNEHQAEQWFTNQLNKSIIEIENLFSQYRLNDALMVIYKLIWDDLCSVYLEAVKPPFGEKIYTPALHKIKTNYSLCLQLLHPFMPFITEEIAQQLGTLSCDVIISSYPQKQNSTIENNENVLEIISEIRNLRASKNIAPKEKLTIVLITENEIVKNYVQFIEKLSNCNCAVNTEIPSTNISSLAGTTKVYMGLNMEIDVNAERKKMMDELNYLQGFLKSVEAKLNNEKFVANAKPEIVEKEKQKRNDALQKIESLELSIKSLSASI